MSVKLIRPADLPAIEPPVQTIDRHSTISEVEHPSSESIGYVTFASSHRANTPSDVGSVVLSFADEKDRPVQGARYEV